MNKIPHKLEKYFWDTPIDTLDPDKHKTYIIERLLDYGDNFAIEWLNNNYSENTIKQTVRESRRISPKTGNYFALIYNLPKKDLRCMKKRFI